MTARNAIPAFDPSSPDAQLLDGFERVRAGRTYAYEFDHSLDDPAAEADLEARDLVMIEDERQVDDNVATTLPGVVARLMLMIPRIDESRWVDAGLMKHGFLALYREIDALEGWAKQIAYATHELIDIEWAQNLAAYERSSADFALALDLKAIADEEELRLRRIGLEQDAFARSVIEIAEKLEDHFSNGDVISQLVRTLAPDHAAFLRKVDIIIAENFQEDATPWLARDALYLSGRIDRERAEGPSC